jgi:hypothetical protein
MDALRPDAVLHTVKPATGEGAAVSGKGGPPFAEVMDQAAQKRLPQLEIREVPTLPPPNESKVHRLTAEKKVEAQAPGGIEKLTNDLQAGHHRMQELIDELKTKTYSPQELLGIQAEMHDLQVQIEVTTKVVAEATSSVRNLMQQQA